MMTIVFPFLRNPWIQIFYWIFIFTGGPGPVISSCPGNIVQPSNSSTAVVFVSWDQPVGSGTEDTGNQASANGFFGVGPNPTAVTYRYSLAGLTNGCTFTVLVPDTGNTAPNPPNCPTTPVNVTTIPGATTATNTFGPFTCTDVEQGAILAQCDPMSGSQFSVGSNAVTCDCTDNGGLANACTFIVIVKAGNTQPGPPNCPDTGVTVTQYGESTSARATFGPFVCSDAEQGSIPATCNPASGSTFNIGGNYAVTCTCTDDGGLQNSCNFFVNVSAGNTQPGLPNCPDTGVTVTTVGGSTSARATFGPFVCSDAEQGSILAICIPASGSIFNIGGNNAVTCTCTDNGGLQNSCNFFVNVVAGNTQPGPPNCPDTGVTITTVGGSTPAVATYGPFVCSDAEQGSILATCNPGSGSTFNIGGNNAVTCTCTDNGGLQNSCNFFVNVAAISLAGNTQPDPPNCPNNGVTVFTVEASQTAVATYGPFFCSDNDV
ncbi:Hyalin [Holothuria leucospilota]|uniref:Hyalin n=1 Tax=Holothuria leucospilota TaxID=206669 RepID=A0A9Q1CL11_HOLLE|nr:Hyalin [Holothuria leucospilota]